jgi:hypothetical protein
MYIERFHCEIFERDIPLYSPQQGWQPLAATDAMTPKPSGLDRAGSEQRLS